ncbi:hypothetical protein NORO109296_26435 [Nocardiopsis rhodophaea]
MSHPAWEGHPLQHALREFEACPPPAGWDPGHWADAKRVAMRAAPASARLVEDLRPLFDDIPKAPTVPLAA